MALGFFGYFLTVASLRRLASPLADFDTLGRREAPVLSLELLPWFLLRPHILHVFLTGWQP